MRHITVGIDESDASLDALRWAYDEARAHPALVTVIHVHTWSSQVIATDAVALPWTTYEEAQVDAETMLDRQLAAVRIPDGVMVQHEVIEGDAADVLVQRSGDADLLVLGTHRHGALHDLVLGSVSRRCTKHAGCPVVLVPHAEKD